MTLSRADPLALRRRLLVIEASLQRLRLQRDAGTLVVAAQPSVLLRRWWRRAGAGGLVAQGFVLWRLWRRLRRAAARDHVRAAR